VPEDLGALVDGIAWARCDEFIALVPTFGLVWRALNATRLLRLEPLLCGIAEEEQTPDFWSRVPQTLGRDLVALSAELHYIRVYTTKGDALILYPFGQAVKDLSNFEGAQIHRSHWVAFAHVQSVQPRGQGAICQLSGGLSLPVSRTRKPALDELISADT